MKDLDDIEKLFNNTKQLMTELSNSLINGEISKDTFNICSCIIHLEITLFELLGIINEKLKQIEENTKDIIYAERGH